MADAPPTSPMNGPAPRNGRKRKAIGLFLIVLAVTVIAGFAWWRYRQTHVTTDDAYIDGRIHLVSARVQGNVTEVRVRDNQPVRTGDPLLRIDPEPFAARESGAASAVAAGAGDVAAARADLVAARSDITAAMKDLEGAKARLAQLSAGIEAARARTDLAAARRSQASRDAARMNRLFERQVISREAFEKSRTDAEVAKAQDDVAKEELRLAEAAIPTQNALIAQREAVISQRRSVAAQREARIRQMEAQVRQRESALAEARLLRRYTTVLSPADGYVTRKSVEVGQVVSPGQSLLAVATLDNVWVVANFKETDIERIRPGQ
ncbi:MAG: HlyD family secretion protein, partial [Desulfobacteria bacterium]